MTSGDAEAYLDVFGDDAVFVRRQASAEKGKPQFAEMIRKMMASDKTVMGARRCIYENDDILVVHSVNDYPDASRFGANRSAHFAASVGCRGRA